MANDFKTGLSRSNDINVLEVASGESATDFYARGCAGDGAFLEQRCAGLALIVAQIAGVVAGSGDEVVSVLVVVSALVHDVHPEVNLRDVATVGFSSRDVNDWEGLASTLTAVHVVGVGVIQTDTVVVRVPAASVAWWVSSIAWLTGSARGLSVGPFWW